MKFVYFFVWFCHMNEVSELDTNFVRKCFHKINAIQVVN